MQLYKTIILRTLLLIKIKGGRFCRRQAYNVLSKYYIRYLVFLAPAALVCCFFNNMSKASQILQLIFAVFMLFGWAINTGMAAYNYPRRTLSAMFLYYGINLLVITALYRMVIAQGFRRIVYKLAGITSFTPMNPIMRFLLGFNIPQEVYVTTFIFILLFIAWIIGVIYRRHHPNPYRPRIMGR